MADLYTAQHEGLVAVHQALADAFAPVVSGARTRVETLIPQARQAAGFLLGHHDMESNVLFTGLRRHGKLRSTDIAFLDCREREHHDIHRLCEELLGTCSALHPHSATVAAQARDVMAILGPHTREEEVGLAPERMRTMIDERSFATLLRELEAARERALERIAAATR